MARSRNIKPSFFQNDLLGELDPIARLAFIGLWTVADFKGCLEYRPKKIKVQLLPYDDCNFEDIAINLEKSGFIRFYSVDGVRYIKILNFVKHQNPHKNEREAGNDIPDISENNRENSGLESVEINRDKNGTTPADSLLLIPDSLNTDSLNPPTDSVTSESKDSYVPNFPQAVVNDKPDPDKEEPLTRKTWIAYSAAYQDRYGVTPVRNKTVSGQLSNFVKRIGREESPHVASFFVNHNNQFYVTKMHTVGLLLADAEKLRTEWATNRTVTQTQARQADQTQARGNVFNKLIQEAKINASN